MSSVANKEIHPKKSDEHHHSNGGIKLPKQFKLILLRFAHSNAYVAIPILAITIATYIQIGDFNWHLNYVAFLFFSTLFLYPLHRLIGLQLTIPVVYSTVKKSI